MVPSGPCPGASPRVSGAAPSWCLWVGDCRERNLRLGGWEAASASQPDSKPMDPRWLSAASGSGRPGGGFRIPVNSTHGSLGHSGAHGAHRIAMTPEAF